MMIQKIMYTLFYSFLCIDVWSFWCPIRFPHKNDVQFVLYLQLFVVGLMSYLPYLCLFAHSGVQHILCCVLFRFCFVFLHLVYPMLPVSLIYSFLIAPSIFSDVYLLLSKILILLCSAFVAIQLLFFRLPFYYMLDDFRYTGFILG